MNFQSCLLVTSSILLLVTSHPIQNTGNTTRCEFSGLPSGYLVVGKTISVPGACMQITCHEDLTISGLMCPTYFHTPDCNLSEMDFQREYPECCPQVLCSSTQYRVD